MAYFYRMLKTYKRPFPPSVSPYQLRTEWVHCWWNKKRDRTKLLQILDPFLIHWEKLLTDPTYSRLDIGYLALRRMLEGLPDNRLKFVSSSLTRDPDVMIETWVEHVEYYLGSTVKAQLQEIILEQISTPTKGYKYSSNITYTLGRNQHITAVVKNEVGIALNFRLRLRNKIVNNRACDPLDLTVYGGRFEVPIEDSHPDYYLLKHMGLSRWNSYLLELVKNQLYQNEIATISGATASIIQKEEKTLWNRLRQTYSSEAI